MKHNSSFFQQLHKHAGSILSSIKSDTIQALDSQVGEDSFLDHKLYRIEQILNDSTTTNEVKVQFAMAEYKEAETYLTISRVF